MLSNSHKKKRKYISQVITKSNIVKTSAQTTKIFKPYWNEYTKEISQKLPLHKKADPVITNFNLSNSPSRRLTQNSWFSVKELKCTTQQDNLQTVSSHYATTSWQEITEYIQEKIKENVSEPKKKRQKMTSKKEVAGKVKKIKLFPTQKQRETLIKWFGTARWTYNQALSAVEKDGVSQNKKALRAMCVNSELFQNENKWVLETPYDIRDEGMNDLLKAYKANFSAHKKGFKIKYRCKKCESESIVIHSKHWKKAGVFYPKTFGTVPIRGAEPLPDKLNYDCHLQKTRLGEFFLCLLMPLEIRGENQAPHWTKIEEGILALDPGVRTFSTSYSPSGLAIEWGKNDIRRIYRLCHALDKLQKELEKRFEIL
ncbi:1786_t:CDS:2 [Gigaspora margarita]|uniref:1786_t:CDS:1 n=1 Tax=Gigaspora margarita TaxID=4874 RepID=A0ABM8W2Z2_GIGMA|nr:1786_t:CDS:2 [Gigaspora margarita]